MGKISPATEFDLSLFYFQVKPDENSGRLKRAIDAWQAAGWKDRTPIDRQIVTACERAFACAPIDLPKAIAGIKELVDVRTQERDFERMAAEAEALQRERSPAPTEGHQVGTVGSPAADAEGGEQLPPPTAPSPGELALEPPHTRWDERRDLQ